MPGGRIKVLNFARRTTAIMTRRTIFLRWPAHADGVMAWGKGALDLRSARHPLCRRHRWRRARPMWSKVLFTGFGPDNEQWLVNGLSWGLDNWIYGASSIHNGPIKYHKPARTVDLGNAISACIRTRGEFEPAAGGRSIAACAMTGATGSATTTATCCGTIRCPSITSAAIPHVSSPIAQCAGASRVRLQPALSQPAAMLERFNYAAKRRPHHLRLRPGDLSR